MSGYTITKKKKFDKNQMILSLAFIFLFGCMLSPFFIILPIQEWLYLPRGHWFFGPPLSTYIVFMLAFLGLAFMLFLKLWLNYREVSNGKWNILYYGIVLLLVTALFLSINQYRYLDGNGVHFNTFWGLKEQHYKWTDIKEVTEITDNGKVRFAFTFNNGEQYHLLLSEDERRFWNFIVFRIQDAEVKFVRKSNNN